MLRTVFFVNWQRLHWVEKQWVEKKWSKWQRVKWNHHLANLLSYRDVKKVLIVNLKRVGFGALMQTAWLTGKSVAERLCHSINLLSLWSVKKVLIVNLKREFEREPNSKILRWMKVHHSEVHGTEIKRIKARRIKLIKKVLFVNLKRLIWIKLKHVKWQWDESHSNNKRCIKASQNEAFWFSPHQPVKSLRCWRKF